MKVSVKNIPEQTLQGSVKKKKKDLSESLPCRSYGAKVVISFLL